MKKLGKGDIIFRLFLQAVNEKVFLFDRLLV